MNNIKQNIYVTSPLLPNLQDFENMLEDIWSRKWLTNNGHYHKKLEKALSEYLGVPYLSLFTNGTLPLITALQAMRITGEVITTPYSFVATTHSIWWNNLKPVFVDVEEATGNIDVDKLTGFLHKDSSVVATGKFHYGVRSDSIIIDEEISPIGAIEYVKYWKEQAEHGLVRQIKRASFVAYHQKLIKDGVVTASSMAAFQREIMGKQYQRLNVCPELQISCTWSKDDAISLDKSGRFVDVVADKARSIMSIFNADRDIGIDSDEAT